MTDEDRKALLAEILRSAKEGKQYAALGTIQRREFSKIIRFTKRLYVEYLRDVPE